ncbi:SCP2 sterol-binding domain-containing protein [Fervidibacillus albus]|uniref:SCP2 sterol-binding domain-containing protein n=1 Tax=Fervidibacillus albus TaxID=2980026 RepID=A0A9E8LU07_9BACI|nr:SCP2 sterol-binding domain-containing protein [Fervidibacillus albus]WAA09608.1 SCP2 sterol-binding domain-containing protein [Fervidibacillus albus]
MGNVDNASVKDLWVTISHTLNENPELYNDLHAVYQFELKEEDKTETYQLSFRDGKVEWSEGSEKEADVVLEMTEADFKKFSVGQLKGMSAFLTGKLKLKGNISLAMKLEKLLNRYEL